MVIFVGILLQYIYATSALVRKRALLRRPVGHLAMTNCRRIGCGLVDM